MLLDKDRERLDGHLVQLKDAPWPKGIIAQIEVLYKEAGLTDPLEQKLVEPCALVFGGKAKENKLDLSKVNWDMVIEYFTYESANFADDDDKVKEMQRLAKRKYGGIFFHYTVYEAGSY